jgi:hypothetical protein
MVQGDITELLRATVRDVMEEFISMMGPSGHDNNEPPQQSEITVRGYAREFTRAATGPSNPCSASSNTKTTHTPATHTPPSLLNSWSIVPLSDWREAETLNPDIADQLITADSAVTTQLPPDGLVAAVPTSWTMSNEIDASESLTTTPDFGDDWYLDGNRI